MDLSNFVMQADQMHRSADAEQENTRLKTLKTLNSLNSDAPRMSLTLLYIGEKGGQTLSLVRSEKRLKAKESFLFSFIGATSAQKFGSKIWIE